MSKLCITLPPFAPDYSGIAAALFELGGLVVIHDASGCTGNYTGYDEPRWFGSDAAVFCSGLRHMDAVLGNDDLFISRIIAAALSLKPAFIAVLGSPVPMVIGTDFAGIAAEIEQRTGIPSFGFASNGLRYYGTGIAAAMRALVERYADAALPKTERTVNLLGMTPIDFAAGGNADDFIRAFEASGITVVAPFCMGLTLDAVKRCGTAALNVVVSQSGIAAARFMQRKFGTPFIVRTPIGSEPAAVEEACAFFGGTKAAVRCEPAANGESDAYSEPAAKGEPDDRLSSGGRVLIAGDQVVSDSIRCELRRRGFSGEICTASLFDTDADFLQPGDAAVRNEKQLRTLVRDGGYKTIVADPLVFQLVRDTSVRCIALPHPGVSGRLSWNTCLRYVSGTMDELINHIMV
ncbi:nitrogenase component 1 [Treponema brennaborense]|uniref:Oxidoreductase/nitrogenase component 1 n=1 Tax=Treponema brennaborense (strain DSM 12168 / CIP 105900 / DD5/3) TaxID=906968 RepID=F4LLI8_TREBD|nr:nitrogenase component 1 [Treponema brennaborense]AEE16652.1 oxidoreductase/nitrogenase component 1 [Treponema brennaborense DSM 12168]